MTLYLFPNKKLEKYVWKISLSSVCKIVWNDQNGDNKKKFPQQNKTLMPTVQPEQNFEFTG